VVKMGGIDFDKERSIFLAEAGRCCGTRWMIFIETGTKRKRHKQKFVFVFTKTLKL
jgi:hypothetical protein